jgi:signal transduction histidine kinase
MATSPARRRWWRRLGVKLFASYLAVVSVVLVTVLLGVRLVASSLFAHHIGYMMGPGDMGRMDQLLEGGTDAALLAAFGAALADALLVAMIAAIATAVVVSLFVSRQVVGPIQRLGAASRRLASGHYAERVPAGGGDELGELAGSFNEMAAALEATERRRRELIGDVAHELRTPVATLGGYLEGLLDGVVEPSEQTWAKLHDEASRLRRLIDDLQELSRAEARQLPVKPRPIDPADIACAAIDRLTGQFDEKGLVFEASVAAKLPRVQADPDRAVQVLTNLLTNALRYTPVPGLVRLELRAVGDAVQFTVADTGVGVAPEHLPHLFERFYRADRSRNRALGGSGIGLTIARALVEAMDGRIWVESPGLGGGATFHFMLPRAP